MWNRIIAALVVLVISVISGVPSANAIDSSYCDGVIPAYNGICGWIINVDANSEEFREFNDAINYGQYTEEELNTHNPEEERWVCGNWPAHSRGICYAIDEIDAGDIIWIEFMEAKGDYPELEPPIPGRNWWVDF